MASRSQALATRQLRLTDDTEIPLTSEISSNVMPPKYHFFQRHAAKISKLNDFCFAFINHAEAYESLFQPVELNALHAFIAQIRDQGDFFMPALFRLLFARMINQGSAHGTRCKRKEVRLVVPFNLVDPHQPDNGLIHQIAR